MQHKNILYILPSTPAVTEEGFEKAKETIGEENVEKIVEVAKDKATEVASGLKDKFQK